MREMITLRAVSTLSEPNMVTRAGRPIGFEARGARRRWTEVGAPGRAVLGRDAGPNFLCNF